MDKLLPKLYKEYGIYSNYRNFPLDLDGLKPVERRVLLSTFKIAREKFVKSRQIDGHTIGHYHPHGECYGTIVQLVRQGLLDGQGNFGSDIGVEPVPASAPRYTECKLSSFTHDIAFRYVNHVEWIDTELGDTEPAFLPTQFPLCLLGKYYTQGIGFGFRTLIPCYSIKDLKNRLLWLLNERKTKPTIFPLTDCDIISPPAAAEELLTTGKAKIDVRGKYLVNTNKYEIALKSWPPGRRFESILQKFSRELEAGLIGWIDLSAGEETNIVFKVIRDRNREKIFNDFLQVFKEAVEGSISFENTVVNSEMKVYTKSIDQMLLDTYQMFKEVVRTSLNFEIDKIKKVIQQYELIEKIKPILKKNMNMEYDEFVDLVRKTLNISREPVNEILTKYQIKKLLTISTDTQKIKEQLNELNNNIKNLNSYVLKHYEHF